MNKSYSNIRRELSLGRSVILFTTGTSMEPLLHDKRKKNATHVLVVPATEPLHIGDMPLVQFSDEVYMLHRVIRIEQGPIYVTRGDNCIGCEYIEPEQVLGVVTEIYEGSKKICVTDKNYLRYVKRRIKNYPIRRMWFRIRSFASKVKRKVL